jgi:zinc protease
MTNRIPLACVLGLAVVVPARAQAPPTVDQILDKYERAIGGRAAFDKFTTRVMIGSSDNGKGLTLPVEIYLKAPNKRVMVLGFGEVSLGFNGDVGWSMNLIENGLVQLTGQRLAATKRSAVFNGESRLADLYEKLTFGGTATINGREMYVVAATPAEGIEEKLHFDRQTGLLVRRLVGMVENDLEDYRDVDGIKLPFTLRQKTPQGGMSIKLREIKHNVPIDDEKFAVPTQ